MQVTLYGFSLPEAWSDTTSYVPYDTATKDGSLYVCLVDSTGDDPATDGGVHWQLAASKGDAGPQGLPGPSVYPFVPPRAPSQWDDEFNGNGLDTNKWILTHGGGASSATNVDPYASCWRATLLNAADWATINQLANLGTADCSVVTRVSIPSVGSSNQNFAYLFIGEQNASNQVKAGIGWYNGNPYADYSYTLNGVFHGALVSLSGAGSSIGGYREGSWLLLVQRKSGKWSIFVSPTMGATWFPVCTDRTDVNPTVGSVQLQFYIGAGVSAWQRTFLCDWCRVNWLSLPTT